MIFLNQFSFSDMFFPLATMATLATPYSHAGCIVASSVFSLATTGNRLTLQGLDNILRPLSNMKVEFSSSFRKGFNKPLSNVVFYCPQKIKAVSIRLLSMVGCIGQPLWLVVPFRDTANSIQPATQCLAAAGSGLHPQKRHTAMNTQTSGEIRPKSNYQKSYEAALHQAKIEDSLNLVLKELGNIEKLFSRAVNDNSFTGFFSSLCGIFQHSQRALNAAHDLKNLLGIAERRA